MMRKKFINVMCLIFFASSSFIGNFAWFYEFGFLSLFLRTSEMIQKGTKHSSRSIQSNDKTKQSKTMYIRLMFIDFRPLNQMLKLIALSNTFRIMMNYGLFHRSIQSLLFLCVLNVWVWIWFLYDLFSFTWRRKKQPWD